MCGLTIIPEPRNNLLVNDGDAVREMLATMNHRGLDGHDSVFMNGDVSIGHRRLPIVGLDHEYDHLQYIARGRFIGALVGEIHNFADFDPNAKSDLKVMLDRFADFGPAAFRTFDGFWSAVVHDIYARKTYVTVDYLAQKPLYVRESDGAIASEIKPLLVDQLFFQDLDEVYLAAVAKWGYCPDGRTPYEGITMLKPGTMVVINHGDSSKTITINDRIYPRKGDIRELVWQSVDRRLVADVPLGVLCSGGLDSTIVYEVMRRRTNDFTLFHVDNGEEEFLNHLKIPSGVKVEKLSLEDVSIEDALYWNEGPVDMGSVVPQLAMAKAVAKHNIPVVLSGDGADELFGGYRRAQEYDSQASDVWHELPYYHNPRLDKLMMSNTIELRAPFLGREVVSAALALPYEKRTNKQALKEAFSDLVPTPILERVKHPLKTAQVRDGGQSWRNHLIETFRRVEKTYGR